jgi:hypothetical protein
MSQETDRIPQPYTPTPDGFERRLRAWVRLPADGGTTSDTGDASASPKSMAFGITPEEPPARGRVTGDGVREGRMLEEGRGAKP